VNSFGPSRMAWIVLAVGIFVAAAFANSVPITAAYAYQDVDEAFNFSGPAYICFHASNFLGSSSAAACSQRSRHDSLFSPFIADAKVAHH
jgi:hypothetical protein